MSGELRWLEREVRLGNGDVRYERVLQYRYTYQGGELRGIWSDWTEVPVVRE